MTIDNNEQNSTRLQENICVHIFSVSAAMVGVCLTVIGIIQIVIKAQGATTIADDLLAIDALLFLVACILSYLSMRSQSVTRIHKTESIADGIFILALVFMVVICVIVAYEISYHETTTMSRHWLRLFSFTYRSPCA
jgi:hypothetical protein